ncbi:hypothetical protein FB451DRAFT_1561245 [Mycena latifolia]|nr:hypothetical protein FB451DRAFT_1561245 [Mycena latifolia]
MPHNSGSRGRNFLGVRGPAGEGIRVLLRGGCLYAFGRRGDVRYRLLGGERPYSSGTVFSEARKSPQAGWDRLRMWGIRGYVSLDPRHRMAISQWPFCGPQFAGFALQALSSAGGSTLAANDANCTTLAAPCLSVNLHYACLVGWTALQCRSPSRVYVCAVSILAVGICLAVIRRLILIGIGLASCRGEGRVQGRSFMLGDPIVDGEWQPSENWDDDFEFQSQSSTRRSTASTALQDQDQDLDTDLHDPQDHDTEEIQNHSKNTDNGRITTTNSNHNRSKDLDARDARRASHDTDMTTENWDDDFAEDDEDEPHANTRATHPASHAKAGSDEYALPPPPAAGRTPRASRQQRANSGATARTVSGSTARPWGDGGGDSSDEDEWGAGGGADEDRTVTARRVSAQRTHDANYSPPPPVPPLPSRFGMGGLALSIPADALGMGMGGGVGAQPFPRSPTASVFSAPDNASIAYTHTSAGSTTALTRPHGHLQKQVARGLAGLPPSPPIHRERRRLRKKSRPGGGGAGGGTGPVEMRELPRASEGRESEDGGGTGTGTEEDWDAEEVEAASPYSTDAPYAATSSRAAAGSTSAVHFAPSANTNPYGPSTAASGSGSGSQSQVALPSSGGGSGGLLARIGSVKRWGFGGEGGDKGDKGRRKKSSSVSVGSELGVIGDPELDVMHDINAAATPRPPSSSSLLRTGSQSSSRSGSRHSYAHPPSVPATPPTKSKAGRYSQYGNSSQHGKQEQYTPRTPPQTPSEGTSASGRGWFFRGASTSGSPAERGRFRGTSGAGGGGGGGGVGRDGTAAADVSGGEGRPYTPTPHGREGEKEREKDKDKEGKTKLVKRRSLGFVQIRRGIRPLNGNAEAADEHSTPVASGANASPSKGYAGLGVGRPSGAAMGSVEDLGRQKEKEREREGMGFVERNVRRISLVGGRHKRTKSGVSITGVGLSGDEKENDGKGKRGARPTVEGLLPPPPVDVQLQPPSPPQTLRSGNGSTATMKASAPINIASPRNLDAPSAAFSPTFSQFGSSPISLASPISMASSSTPSLTPYSGVSTSPPHSHSNSPSPKPPVSPHSASLGRAAAISPVVSAAAATPVGAAGAGTMRRNSLGDLKIPARISQAQVGLRRDLGMVREFARNVEELKELQGTYQTLVSEVQGILDMHVLHPSQFKEKEKESRVSSPTFFKRHRSNTSSSNPNAPSPQEMQQAAYKQLASAFYTINSKYRISWECAELLIELGGGSPASPPSTSTSAPAMQSVGGSDGLRSGKSKARERAITLQDDAIVPPSPGPLTGATGAGAIPGPPLASPPSNLAWRASTGRNDLSQRQLLLLKEMLGSPVPGGPDESFGAEDGIPEEVMAAAVGNTKLVNREWRWGDAMNSTVTLPSEESGVQAGGTTTKEKKRRSSRLRMSGIRDMLRSLKKGGTTPPVPVSTTSVSTESSGDLNAQHLYQHRQVPTNGKRRRAKTSADPESIRSNHRPLSPFEPSSLKTASPRRPSLASIFRIGRGKTPPTSAAADVSLESVQADRDLYPTFSGISGGRESAGNSTGEDDEEDWDRMEDSASEAEAAAALARRGGATIRGRSPYLHASFLTPSSGHPTTPMRSPSGSRTSIQDPSGGAPARATRLSNVEEHVGSTASKAESPSRQFSRSRRGGKTGSVRSMPPVTLPDPKLAMTPENIRPLLENAREVHARLSDCIAEIRSLLAARP